MVNLTAGMAKRDPARELQGGPATAASPLSTDFNVLVIVLDDIGTDWFLDYQVGHIYTTDEDFAYPLTPFIDECTAGGLLFQDATSESVCSPTRVQINTGRQMHRTGVGFNMRDPQTVGGPGTNYPVFGYSIPDSETFLAEHIRSSRPEVETAAFGKWHMCDGYTYQVTPGIPDLSADPPNTNLTDYLRFGFQHWTGNVYNVGGKYAWWKNVDGVLSYVVGPPYDETTYPTAVIADAAASWLASRTGPFFGYVAFGPPHAEFTVPPLSMISLATAAELAAAGFDPGEALDENSLYQTANFPLLWRAMMEATDTACRRVWEAIPIAQRARTFLIITGDNGTVGNARIPGFSHEKRTLYWGGTRVPFIIRGPSVASPGRKVVAKVMVADIFRTVCEMMRVDVSDSIAQDSVSIMPVVKNAVDRTDTNAIREFSFCQSFRPMGELNPANWNQRQRAIWDGRYRFMNLVGVEHLYDNAADPLEVNNVIDKLPYADEVERLREELETHLPD